jgi:hypothetical protein
LVVGAGLPFAIQGQFWLAVPALVVGIAALLAGFSLHGKGTGK